MSSKSETVTLSKAVKEEIDMWLEKFPQDQRQSALLPGLMVVQNANQGWLSEALIKSTAEYIGVPEIAAFEVATFYSMYELEPVGRYKLEFCTNISCMLCGANKIVEHVKNRLRIGFGETTDDGKFTMKEVECLGACVNAPAMMLGDKYYENLTPEMMDDLLDELE